MQGIAIREFARRDGCDDKLVRKAIQSGRIKAYPDGSLDPALVGTGWRKGNRNGADADVRMVRDGDRQTVVRDGPPEEVLNDFIERILRGDFTGLADAERIKENALALKHLLDGRKRAGSLVEIETAQNILFEEFRAARDAWLNFPSRIGPVLAAELGVEAERLTEALTAYVHQQLNDLGDPEVDFTGGETEDGGASRLDPSAKDQHPGMG